MNQKIINKFGLEECPGESELVRSALNRGLIPQIYHCAAFSSVFVEASPGVIDCISNTNSIKATEEYLIDVDLWIFKNMMVK